MEACTKRSYMPLYMSDVHAMYRQAPQNWRFIAMESILLAIATFNDPLLPVQHPT